MNDNFSPFVKGSGKGEGNPQSKLCDLDVLEIKRMLLRGVPRKEICAKFDVGLTCIHNIANKRTWRHVVLPESEIENV